MERWTNREFYQKHFLDHSACWLELFNGNSSMWKLSGKKVKSLHEIYRREIGRGANSWRVKSLDWFCPNIFDDHLSRLCIEDAFETYLPASMIPSENVIRLENRISKSRICRFHKSVNCLSESSQIQTETWLFVWRVVSEVTFRKCKYLCELDIWFVPDVLAKRR